MANGGGDAFAELIAPADPCDFFAHIWQKEPRVFSRNGADAGADGPKGADRVWQRPLPEQTWADCCDFLALAWGAAPIPMPDGCDLLVFSDKQLTRGYDDVGPCHALLDGASCVVNHAEYIWQPFARLCKELREKLVHVYVNSYVTPPGSQAVPPHADDRDVFVLQLCGRKRWKVYRTPPVKLPYSDEQVGKHGLPIPPEILAEPPVIECYLCPGDVLYMPRGFVHEAFAPDDDSSWHATLAVATHDWSWSKMISSAVGKALDSQSDVRWRAAVPLELGAGMPKDDSTGEKELEEALEVVRRCLKAQSLRQAFKAKIAKHNKMQERYAVEFCGCLRDFQSKEDPDCWPYFRPCLVGASTSVRLKSGEEQREEAERLAGKGLRKGMGKGKGKGKDKGQSNFHVRDNARLAVRALFAELTSRSPAGLSLGDFREAIQRQATQQQSDATKSFQSFDSLTALCFARAGFAQGAFAIVDGARRHQDQAADSEAAFCEVDVGRKHHEDGKRKMGKTYDHLEGL